METLVAWAVAIGHAIIANANVLVGFVMPFFVEFINRDITSKNGKMVMAGLACFIAAVILHWNEVAYGTPDQVILMTGLFFMESQFLYNLYFKNSFIREKIRGSASVSTPPVEEETVTFNSSRDIQ